MLLGEVDVRDLVRGASILGTGGGGDPKHGLSLLISDLERGKELHLVRLEEIDPDDLTVTSYFAGTVGSPEPESTLESDLEQGQEGEAGEGGGRRIPEFPVEHMLDAVRILESRVGSEVGGIIPTEIGGRNTALALHVAAQLGVPVGDADHVGRSAPELVHSVFLLEGIPLSPASVASSQGDLVLVERYSDVFRYEDLVRSIATVSGGRVFVADTPVPSTVAREVAIPNSISKAIELGRLVREAVRSAGDPAEIAASFLNGKVILRGRVEDYKLVDEGGFLIGEYVLRGVGEHEGRQLRVWVKNENIMAWWEDGEPAVMPPDLICLIDPEGWGIVNNSLRKGISASVVAAPTDDRWRTEKGLQVFGPRHFGFEFDYIPVEELW